MTKSKTLRVQVVAAVTAMMLVSFMVVRTSSAAFNDTKDSATSTVGSATLLFDDAGSTVSGTFSASDVLPGVFSDTVCYDVKYSAEATADPSNLSLAAAITGTDGTNETALGITDGAETDTGLDEYLTMTVNVGAAGETCATLTDAGGLLSGVLNTDYEEVFSGTMDTFSTVDLDAGLTNLTGWNPDPATDSDLARAFVIEVSLGDVGNGAQGDSVDATFTWQADQ